ncbi:MAG: type II toxin-antitoxin system RelE/ParE family toxin [Thiotrichales bacterium]
MAEIIWTEPALVDLEEIAEYIALDKIDAAKKLVKKVFSTIDRLEQFPESGRNPIELPNSRYREVIVGPCRVFYRISISDDKVYILYVIRAERQLRKYLLEERGSKSS